MNRQVTIKCEQIARMIVKGIPKTRIALEMGMSYDGLQRITRVPEYLAIEESVRNAVIGKMDARLAKRAEMDTEMEDHVPEAMKVLLEAVTKKRDLRAALEVLDRDPKKQFARVRVDQQTTVPGLPTETLAAAVKEADLTHTILQNSQQVQTLQSQQSQTQQATKTDA